MQLQKLKNEIERETLDDKGVRLVFLFAVSNDHEYARNHMLLLADIEKAGNDEAVERLLKVETVEELKDIFAEKIKVPHLSSLKFQREEKKGSIKNTTMNRKECQNHFII